jgi:acyl-CoA carboxylase epsilon subunit
VSTADAQPAQDAGHFADLAPAVTAITVNRGRPTDAELAALISVLLAALAGAPMPPGDPPPPSRWAERGRVLSAPPRPGPHSWRASALPH